ncbi:hybrid sensor histidine kinase/response regulator [Candidatus Fermentibacteria bacterium]|nr:hybrid sensor histidine kinase/response regulator [Candidatus Fermentibacteria bacterium]
MASEHVESESILVVDDEPQIRSLLGRFLRRRGSTVLEAGSGAEGLALFQKHSPAVVISDIRMPGMGGFDLLRAVRKIDAEVEVVLITGYGEISDAVEAIRTGASDFIAKPFDLTLVDHAVDSCLERRRYKAMARGYTRRLEEEVTRRTEELAHANRELEKLGKTREDFLALISHELRTPLAGMGLAELAFEEIDSLTRGQVQEMLSGIIESFRRLHAFSERALLYSRLASGGPVRRREGVDFSELVHDEVSRIAKTAADADISVRWAPFAGSMTTNGDPELLRFVIRALLDNAVKHNRRGGSAEVHLEPRDDGFEFSITDTGVGIPGEAIDRVFRPLDSPDILHRRSGTSLSLAISRLISQQHGMQLSCSSEGTGKGATFTLTCPAHQST